MTAPLAKVESIAANESPVPEHSSREETMTAEHASCSPLERNAPDRRLRNRIIIANVIVWIAIIVLIRLIFF
jgi:hypothetical protein